MLVRGGTTSTGERTLAHIRQRRRSWQRNTPTLLLCKAMSQAETKKRVQNHERGNALSAAGNAGEHLCVRNSGAQRVLVGYSNDILEAADGEVVLNDTGHSP